MVNTKSNTISNLKKRIVALEEDVGWHSFRLKKLERRFEDVENNVNTLDEIMNKKTDIDLINEMASCKCQNTKYSNPILSDSTYSISTESDSDSTYNIKRIYPKKKQANVNNNTRNNRPKDTRNKKITMRT